jgi:signal transduction histidine kinase
MGAARLVPRSDGYADYVEHPAVPGVSRGQGQHRYARGRGERAAGRQRSIRSTITILLVIPLLSLIALWLYAATSTVGGALSKRDTDTVNTDIGAPLEGLIAQLATERADTFVWQSAEGHLPRQGMLAQRPRTDAAIAAFTAGATAAFSVEPAADRPLAQALLGQLRQIGALRAKIDAGKISPVAAFQGYNSMAAGIYPFAAAFTNSGSSIQLSRESQALLEEGESVDDVGQEATLVAGAQVAGDRMSAAGQRVFAQTVDNQLLLAQLGNSPLYWQASPDPYAGIFTSREFAQLTKLQDAITGTPAGTPLRVSPRAWQDSIAAVTAKFTAAETAGRLGVTKGDTHASDIILLRLILVGGAGLAAVVVSSLLLLRFGNRISRELSALRGAARVLAEERLPHVVARLRAGDDVDVDAEAPPLDLPTKTREVTETAGAFSAVRRTAIEAAVEQAQLRKAVSLVFRSLARRNQSLLQRQLKMLDEMERATDEPQALEQLFRLDHLTTRMRRQAEGLIVLSGAAPGRSWRQPVPVIEVLRGALGEIEDFARVDLSSHAPDFLQGAGVADVMHLLAELIENAVLYSPPSTRVQVRCSRVANGYAVEVEDAGLGIPAELMTTLNLRLARPPEFDLADSDQLGLFVVSRLAARQQVKVSLRPSAYGGTLAVALLPPSLVVSEEQAVFLAASPVSSGGAAAPSAGAAPASAGVPPDGGVGGMRRASLPPSGGDRRATATAAIPRRDRVSSQVLPAPTGSAGLPRREPMASMAPQLRDNPRSAQPSGALAGRSPEQARTLLSSIRQGWRAGLADPARAGDRPDQETGWDRDERSAEEPP